MSREILVERFFETLINGDRDAARIIVQEATAQGGGASELLTELFWPTHEMIERLHRADTLTPMAYHLSTRLLRTLVDQTSAHLKVPTARTRTVFAACGPSQGEELAAQIAVDLLEANGFHVTFAGGGVPADEILAQVHERRPDFLLLFASAASDLPDIRNVIDTLREIGASPKTRVVVGGGVFNRAEGLAEEIGVELSARTPTEMVQLLTQSPAVSTSRNVRLDGTKRRGRAAA